MFCHVQENRCAAHGGEMGSHLGVTIHSFCAFYAKGEVSLLMFSSGCCLPFPSPVALLLLNPSGLRRHCDCTAWCSHCCSWHGRRRHSQVLSLCSPFSAHQKPRPPHLPVFTSSVASQEQQLVVFPQAEGLPLRGSLCNPVRELALPQTET